MLKDLFSMEDFNTFSSLIEKIIPEGTDTEMVSGDTKIKIHKHDGEFNFEIITGDDICEDKKCNKPVEEKKADVKKFDDSDVKCRVKRFKNAIKQMDDDVFTSFIDQLHEDFDLNTMNKLIDLEHYTEEEACHTVSSIACFTTLFEKFINGYKCFLDSELKDYINALQK